MRFNKYLFKKYLHTLKKETFHAFHGVRLFVLKLTERFSRTGDAHLWIRKTFSLKTLYTRLILRGEYVRRDFIVLFILAFFAGFAGKSMAADFFTIGFEDYRLPPKETLLDLNAVQKKIIENNDTFIESDVVPGGMCSE